MTPSSLLGSLAQPESHHGSINIEGFDAQRLLHFLKSMMLIRECENTLARGRRDGLIGGPVHLGVGQEAIAVGVSENLTSTDRVFGAHRSHSHILALNPDPHKLFAEVLARSTGFSKGMGGSMHLWDQNNGFYGAVPIVAGTVPLAVGAALAAKLQKTNDVGVVYAGDGAFEEGVVHESLNFASIQTLPMLFVAENNLFASHMHISQRQPADRISRFADANGINSFCIDGNDLSAVIRSASALIEDARAGKGPGLLEVVTYRWYGHVDWRDDIDVGVNRSLEDVANWKARDPIARLESALLESESTDEALIHSMREQVRVLVEQDWEKALNDPHPDEGSILDYVYA